MTDAPAAFVLEWLPSVSRELGPRPRALDLAMGTGRHALLLAARGYLAFGVDRDRDRVAEAARSAREGGLTLRAWIADLEEVPLPIAGFDLLLCTNYLQRDLWPAVRAAVKPDGFVLYQTFTTGQLALGLGPRSPDHLLQPGELRAAFEGWDVWHYDEVEQPSALATLVARKPPA